MGGIREKMLAARQAGVRVVVFPEKNRVDVKDLPLDVKQNTEIRLVDNIDEIINTALI